MRILCVVLCLFLALPAFGEGTGGKIAPEFPVPDYVQYLLEIAGQEVGYTEERSGVSKYGTWAGDPKAQWCAEYLCWCVDQTDRRHGTNLLKNVYPLYGGTNVGLNWFLKEGRYVARTGSVNGWGSQWLRGEDKALQPGGYIPQPGDWAFFSYTPSGDTTHVAMVEYCARDEKGRVLVHVLEGNNPDKVQRAAYLIGDWRILGYGTVHDVADIALRGGNEGEKVRQLQLKLSTLGHLANEQITGRYGQKTADAVKSFQLSVGINPTGIANQQTQLKLNEALSRWETENTDAWTVDGAL